MGGLVLTLTAKSSKISDSKNEMSFEIIAILLIENR